MTIGKALPKYSRLLIKSSRIISIIFCVFIGAIGYGNTNEATNSEMEKPAKKQNDLEYLNASLKREFATLNEQLSHLKELESQSQALYLENKKQLELENADLTSKLRKLEGASSDLDARILRATEHSEFQLEMNDLLLSTTQMAKDSIRNWNGFYGKKTKDDRTENGSVIDDIAQSIGSAKQFLKMGQEIYVRPETYVNPDGKEISGNFVHIGAIAAMGLSGDNKQNVDLLAPLGNGRWHSVNEAFESKSSFSKFIDRDPRRTAFGFVDGVPLFLFNDFTKGIVLSEKKTTADTVEAGGLIGYVILVLGLIALILIVVRAALLYRFGIKKGELAYIDSELIEKVSLNPSSVDGDRRFSETAKRLLKKIVPALDTPQSFREKVAEFLLGEFRVFDRFGSLITVIATVAPLLGLLGTVTGMISTFDLITEFGTGDPKMLSGGISEALVTTMLGLMVAIPALFCGNLLNSWQEKIKKSMQQSILKLSYIGETGRLAR